MDEYKRFPAWERLVKRQVRARDWEFHAICSPGFEPQALGELQPYFLQAEIKGPGSLGWSSRIAQAHEAMLTFKTINRLMVRLDTFHAGAMEELFRKTLNIPWEAWLPRGTVVKVVAQVERSRLSHEGRAAITVEEAITKRLFRDGLNFTEPPSSPIRVLVRVVDNSCTLSLDASGELHYRRGYRLAMVKAPIRESLAASLILWGLEGFTDLDNCFVVDPLCGGGTMAIEAVGILSGAITGLGRTFAMEAWPALSEASKNHHRKPKETRSIPWFCSDLDPQTLKAALVNTSKASAMWNIQGPTLECLDFFSRLAPQGQPGHGILVINPPYGLRIDVETSGFFKRLSQRIASHWKGYRVICIVPDQGLLGYFPPHARRIGFKNGGLGIHGLAWDQ